MPGIARAHSSAHRRFTPNSRLPMRKCRSGVANRLRCLIRTTALAFEVRGERRRLLGMHDGMLKDLGLTGIAEAEASRRFWDIPLERLHADGICRCGCGAGD